MSIERRFLKTLEKLELPKNDSCLVALSGGGDSMALLDLLYQARRTYPLRIAAARVVHGIRSFEEDKFESQLCESACQQRLIEFQTLEPAKEDRIRHTHGRGVEQAARTLRHNLLKRYADEIGAHWIFYAHNAEDGVETIFMRLLAGSGIEGLVGIRELTGRICRPLVGFSRRELREYLTERGILWAEDSSNAENSYRRNRFRNELIPLMTDIFPGWPAALGTLGERSLEALETLRWARSMELPEHSARHGEWPRAARPIKERISWKESDWKRATGYSQALAIWHAFNRLDTSEIPDRRFSWRALKAARTAVNEGRDWNSPELTLTCQNGLVVATEGEKEAVHALDDLQREDLLKGAPANLKWRLILNKKDVNPMYSAKLGGISIQVTTPQAPKSEEFRAIAIETGWPLVLEFDRSGKTIMANSMLISCDFGGAQQSDSPRNMPRSVLENHDICREIVYISIEPAKEGADAG